MNAYTEVDCKELIMNDVNTIIDFLSITSCELDIANHLDRGENVRKTIKLFDSKKVYPHMIWYRMQLLSGYLRSKTSFIPKLHQ